MAEIITKTLTSGDKVKYPDIFETLSPASLVLLFMKPTHTYRVTLDAAGANNEAIMMPQPLNVMPLPLKISPFSTNWHTLGGLGGRMVEVTIEDESNNVDTLQIYCAARQTDHPSDEPCIYPMPWVWKGMRFAGPVNSLDPDTGEPQHEPFLLKYIPLEETKAMIGQIYGNKTESGTQDQALSFPLIPRPQDIVGGLERSRVPVGAWFEYASGGGLAALNLLSSLPTNGEQLEPQEDPETGIVDIMVLSSVKPYISSGSVTEVAMAYGDIICNNACQLAGEYKMWRVHPSELGIYPTIGLDANGKNCLTRAALYAGGGFWSEGDWWDCTDVNISLLVAPGENWTIEVMWQADAIPAEWAGDYTAVVRAGKTGETLTNAIEKNDMYEAADLRYASFTLLGSDVDGQLTIDIVCPQTIPLRVMLIRGTGESSTYMQPVTPVILMGSTPENSTAGAAHFRALHLVDIRAQVPAETAELGGVLEYDADTFAPYIEAGALVKICPEWTLYFADRYGIEWSLPLFRAEFAAGVEKETELTIGGSAGAPVFTPIYRQAGTWTLETPRLSPAQAEYLLDHISDAPQFFLSGYWHQAEAAGDWYVEVQSIEPAYQRDSAVIRIVVKNPWTRKTSLTNLC